MKTLLAAAATVPLAACVTSAPVSEDLPRRVVPGSCNAAAAQGFVGQRATAESGAAILKATGASTLRWLLPNTIVTMEYAAGRVNVTYQARPSGDGEELDITRVTCG